MSVFTGLVQPFGALFCFLPKKEGIYREIEKKFSLFVKKVYANYCNSFRTVV